MKLFGSYLEVIWKLFGSYLEAVGCCRILFCDRCLRCPNLERTQSATRRGGSKVEHSHSPRANYNLTRTNSPWAPVEDWLGTLQFLKSAKLTKRFVSGDY